MARVNGFLLLILLSTTFMIEESLAIIVHDINFWCNQTPFPNACNRYLHQVNRSNSTNIDQRRDFLFMAVKAAVKKVDQAHGVATLLKRRCHGRHRERAALTDCLKLYKASTHQLNQILDDITGNSGFDFQTWLSAALTNLDTCKTGFNELHVTKNILPKIWLLHDDVYRLISNCLVINNVTSPPSNYLNREGFKSFDGSKGQWEEIPDLVVAKDGTGDFFTIKEALTSSVVKRIFGKRFVIHVKSGVYDERIEVGINMKNITLVGDGFKNTIITGNGSLGGGFSTFNSATFSVVGDGFMAKGVAFRNTAGPTNGQAVALISRSDRSVFYRCSFEGYQDTLYVHSQRQFYAKCHVFGTVDFIFGNAAVVFQNCLIHGRWPYLGHQIVITAQSRTSKYENTGISIHRSIIAPAKDHNCHDAPLVAYLGRPWRDYARVAYLETYFASFVPKVGWSQWGNNTGNLDTLYYGEYKNLGPGSSLKGRVTWRGFHDVKNRTEANMFSVTNLIDGQSWLPEMGVPYRPHI